MKNTTRDYIYTWCAKLPARIPAFGILCAVIGIVFDSLLALFGRLHVLAYMNPMELLFFRSFTQYIIWTTVVAINKGNILGVQGERTPLLCFTLSSSAAVAFLYFAFRLIPLADMYAISMSTMVLVLPMAYVTLREPITLVHVGTGIITIMGALITCRPTFIFAPYNTAPDPDRALGIILVFGFVVCWSPCMIFLRQIRNTPTSVSCLWITIGTFIVSTVIMPFYLDAFVMPKDIYACLLLAAQGAIGAMSSLLRVIAFRYESAGPLTLATGGMIIVMGFIWDITVFGERILWTSVVGSGLVALAIVINSQESHLAVKSTAINKD